MDSGICTGELEFLPCVSCVLRVLVSFSITWKASDYDMIMYELYVSISEMVQ